MFTCLICYFLFCLKLYVLQNSILLEYCSMQNKHLAYTESIENFRLNYISKKVHESWLDLVQIQYINSQYEVIYIRCVWGNWWLCIYRNFFFSTVIYILDFIFLFLAFFLKFGCLNLGTQQCNCYELSPVCM